MKTVKKSSNARQIFLTVLLTVLLVGFALITSIFYSQLQQEKLKLNNLLENQSQLIELRFKNAFNFEKQLNTSLTPQDIRPYLSSISQQWNKLSEQEPGLNLYLVYTPLDSQNIQVILTTQEIDDNNRNLIKELTAQAQKAPQYNTVKNQYRNDYIFHFNASKTVIPKQWVLIIGNNSQQLNKQIIEYTIYLAGAALLSLLFALLFFKKSANGNSTKSQQLYADLVSQSGNWVWEISLQGQILFSNNQIKDILGYNEIEIESAIIDQFFADTGNHTNQLIFKQNLMQKKAFHHLEIPLRHKDGHTTYLLMSAFPSEQGKNTVFKGMGVDISETKKQHDQAINQSIYDNLTGLINRQHFIDQLDKHLQRKKIHKEPQPSALLFMDIDDFNHIKKQQGEDISNELIKIVTKRMHTHIRQTDLLSRFGDDEFVLLLNSQPTETLSEFNKKLQTYVERLIQSINANITVEDKDYQISISIGIAQLPQDGETVTEVLNHADIAMYEAKSRGKNTYEFFNVNTKALVDKKLKTAGELAKAIDNEELTLHYQIQYSDGQASGIEALLRWHHPVSRKVLSAGEFIKSISDASQIHIIDQWVIHKVAKDMASIQQHAGRLLPVSINLSSQEVMQNTIIDDLTEALKEHKIPTQYLNIEVSENVLADSFNQTSKTIKKLDQLGINTIIDHFGTGQLSLANLQIMPIQAIKIDQKFVEQVASNHSDLQMCRAIIQLAKTMQMQVIAGCIETSIQKDILAQEGCDIMQGYHYSKPLELSKLIETLSN